MKAFVTGSTGLLGTNLVRELVARGWEVKALARSAEKAEAELGVRFRPLRETLHDEVSWYRTRDLSL